MKSGLFSIVAVAAAICAWTFVDRTSPTNRRKVPGSVMTIVREGRLRADIVLPAKPLDCERYAAEND